MKKFLTNSQENYLLGVCKLVKQNKAARVKDVADFLGVGPSSASDAVKLLAEKEYINYKPYGLITVTPKGQKKALELEARHKTICNFLENVLLIEAETAEESAKSIEFNITTEVLERFVEFMSFMDNCSSHGPQWMKSFKNFLETGERHPDCVKCSCRSR